MTTIPRVEIRAIQERHNDLWDPLRRQESITIADVRKLAQACRDSMAEQDREADRQESLAEADDLDALADRYEREAS